MATEATTMLFYHLNYAKGHVIACVNPTMDGAGALQIGEIGGNTTCIFATDDQLRLIRNAINARLEVASVGDNATNAATREEVSA